MATDGLPSHQAIDAPTLNATPMPWAKRLGGRGRTGARRAGAG